MAINEEQLQFIKDQLSESGPYEAKKMFGGVGFFREGIMFGLYGQDVFHLRVDDGNRAAYEAHGKTAFMSSEKKKGMPYYEVPLTVLEDRHELKNWVEEAYAAALRSKK